MDTPGDRLRCERLRLGYNQADFAALGGVKKQAQIKYEKGERQPDAAYLSGIATVGADVGFVLTGDTAAQRAVYDMIRRSTERATSLGGPPEEIAALRDAEVVRRLQARQPISVAEGTLIADFRACEPGDQQIVSRMAATLAASKSKSLASDSGASKSPKRRSSAAAPK